MLLGSSLTPSIALSAQRLFVRTCGPPRGYQAPLPIDCSVETPRVTGPLGHHRTGSALRGPATRGRWRWCPERCSAGGRPLAPAARPDLPPRTRPECRRSAPSRSAPAPRSSWRSALSRGICIMTVVYPVSAVIIGSPGREPLHSREDPVRLAGLYPIPACRRQVRACWSSADGRIHGHRGSTVTHRRPTRRVPALLSREVTPPWPPGLAESPMTALRLPAVAAIESRPTSRARRRRSAVEIKRSSGTWCCTCAT